MKFVCTQNNLASGLNLVAHITSKNISLPILGNVLIKADENGIELLTTNLEIGIKAKIRGKIEKKGSFTVQASLFSNYINLLPPDSITVEQKDASLAVQCQNHKTKINGVAAGEFPTLPRMEKKDGINLRVGDFKEGLAQVVFAASFNEIRPEISGVLFSFSPENLILVGTDSYRLAERKLPLQKNSASLTQKTIIPLKTLQEVLRILGTMEESEEVSIYPAENQILFLVDEVEIISRLIEGQYPSYEEIIPPKYKTQAILDREELIQAVKRASLFCSGGVNDVSIEFVPAGKNETAQVIVSSTHSQLGESQSIVQAALTGEANKIIFNYRFLLDGLSHLAEKEVSLEVISDTSPGVLKPAGKGAASYLYLIMPIKGT